jgi:hypothetical protein
MTSSSSRLGVLVLLAASVALLIPGIFAPVLSISGVLTKEGIAQVAPQMLDKGLSDETIKTLTSMMNPTMVAFLKATGGDVKKMIMDKLGPQLTTALQNNVSQVEVYHQTRSILGSVRNLYDLGAWIPATLILIFSVVVPFTKAALVAAAVFMKDYATRQRVLDFVEAIAKWSMADVFAVALLIAYLAAVATQQPTGGVPPLVAFDATFGSGFYWFAGYCLFSLGSQQYTAKLARQASAPAPAPA